MQMAMGGGSPILSPVPMDSLVIQLAMQELLPRLTTSRLSIDDARKAGRTAKARVRLPIDDAARVSTDRALAAWRLNS